MLNFRELEANKKGIFMPIKKTKREIKTQDTKKRILETSYDLFLEYGVDTVTVDDICAHCQITKGTFYHYFPSKDHVMSISLNNQLNNYLETHFSFDEEKMVSVQMAQLLESAMTFFQSTGKEMIRKATESLTRSCVDVDSALHGKTFVAYLQKLIERGLEENCFVLQNNALSLRLQFQSLLCGAMVFYSIQNDSLDPIVDWNRILTDQVLAMFSNGKKQES